MAHLRADKNIRCHMAYFRRSDHKKKASHDPIDGTAASKRQKAIAEIEKALQDAELEERRHKVSKQSNSSMFDFVNDVATEEVMDAPNEPANDKNEEGRAESMEHPPVEEGKGLSSGLDKFKLYVEHARRNRAGMEPSYKAGVKLMHIMNKKGGSLELYEAIFDWHIEHLEDKRQEKITHDRLFKFLIN